MKVPDVADVLFGVFIGIIVTLIAITIIGFWTDRGLRGSQKQALEVMRKLQEEIEKDDKTQ